VGESAPPGHGVHKPLPVNGLYVPAKQAVHTVPFEAAVYPALQIHALSAVLADGELVPLGHVVHTPTPVSGLYVPAKQAVHVVPVYPARQIHALDAILAEGESATPEHVVHTPLPVAVLYVPSTQAVHKAPVYPAPQVLMHVLSSVLAEGELVPIGHVVQPPLPVPVLYVPAKQAVHEAPVYPALHVQDASVPLPKDERVLGGHKRHVVDAIAVVAVE